eukprot:UN18946
MGRRCGGRTYTSFEAHAKEIMCRLLVTADAEAIHRVENFLGTSDASWFEVFQ